MCVVRACAVPACAQAALNEIQLRIGLSVELSPLVSLANQTTTLRNSMSIINYHDILDVTFDSAVILFRCVSFACRLASVWKASDMADVSFYQQIDADVFS